jgi:hypothetical protein
MVRKRAAGPALVRATVQANVGGWRAGQVVEVHADSPLLGHYLLPVDPPDPDPPPTALLGVAPPDDGEDSAGAEPG